MERAQRSATRRAIAVGIVVIAWAVVGAVWPCRPTACRAARCGPTTRRRSASPRTSRCRAPPSPCRTARDRRLDRDLPRPRDADGPATGTHVRWPVYVAGSRLRPCRRVRSGHPRPVAHAVRWAATESVVVADQQLRADPGRLVVRPRRHRAGGRPGGARIGARAQRLPGNLIAVIRRDEHVLRRANLPW